MNLGSSFGGLATLTVPAGCHDIETFIGAWLEHRHPLLKERAILDEIMRAINLDTYYQDKTFQDLVKASPVKAESTNGKNQMTYMQRHLRKKELLMRKVSPKRQEVLDLHKLAKVVPPPMMEYLST